LAVVVIKTPLDASPRESVSVTVCARCTVTVQIEEGQPSPDTNMDYHLSAVENPEYIRVKYAPTPLSNFASSAYQLRFGAVGLGIVLLLYSRASEK